MTQNLQQVMEDKLSWRKIFNKLWRTNYPSQIWTWTLKNKVPVAYNMAMRTLVLQSFYFFPDYEGQSISYDNGPMANSLFKIRSWKCVCMSIINCRIHLCQRKPRVASDIIISLSHYSEACVSRPQSIMKNIMHTQKLNIFMRNLWWICSFA